MNRQLNLHPNPVAHRQQLPPGRHHPPTGYKMSVPAWVLARQPRFAAVQECTFQLRRMHTTTGTGGCAKVFTARRPFSLDSRLFQLGTDPFSFIPTKPESLYTPNDAKVGPGKRGPARPRTGAAPCGRSFPARFWFTLSGGACDRADRQDRGEVNDLTRKLNGRPDPADHWQHLALRCRHLTAAYKNVRFTLELCTSEPFSRCTKMPVSPRRLARPHRNPPASPGVHCSPPAGGQFPPFRSYFSFGTALQRAGVQKCAQVPIPVHPDYITGDGACVGA